VMSNADTNRPNSANEHKLQKRFDNVKRAKTFYNNQMLDHLTPLMREFAAKQKIAFIATANAHSDCDATFRARPARFIHVLDEKTVIWPEYKGNGVTASQSNITENGHVGILMINFFETAVDLHINSRASIVPNEAVEAFEEL